MSSEQNFTLRQCGPGDEQRLSLVGGASFLEAFAGVLNADDILAHYTKNHSPEMYAKYIAMPTGRVAIVEASVGHAPIGYIVCCEPDLPVDLSQQDYELRRIYLLHRFQGLGIGRALMEHAVQYARDLGRTRLLLGVYGKNHDAIRFYERAGFSQIGERFFTVGATTHHDAVMAKVL